MKTNTFSIALGYLCLILSLMACKKENLNPVGEEPLAIQSTEQTILLETPLIDIPVPDCPHAPCAEVMAFHQQLFQDYVNEICEKILVGIECCDQDGNPVHIDMWVHPNAPECAAEYEELIRN